MLTLFGGTITQPLNDSGDPVPLGKIYFFETGTTTPKDTFTDADGGGTHTNPVVLDGNGRAVIFLADDGAYDIVFTDPDDATIWSLVKVIASAPVI